MTPDYCTFFDSHYLVRGEALVESLRSVHGPGGFRLTVVCLDELTRVVLRNLAHAEVELVALHELERYDSALLEAKAKRTQIEYYWTLTPTVILRLLQRIPAGTVLHYLDADLFFFSDPAPVFQEMAGADILIHEHRYGEEQGASAICNGRFNVGFMGFRHCENSLAALAWWRARCLEWCHARHEDGKMGDQLYLEDWPERFSGVRILANPGAAVAPWNHSRWRFSGSSEAPSVDGHPVIFYHFHSLAILHDEILLTARHTAYPMPGDTLRLCYTPYAQALTRAILRIRKHHPEFRLGLREDVQPQPRHTFLATRRSAPVFTDSGAWRNEEPTFAQHWSPIVPVKPTLPGVPTSAAILAAGENSLFGHLAALPASRDLRCLMIVGAHRFQERGLIDRVFPNLQHILLVEPLPSLQPHLESIAREDRRIRVFACALDSQDGQAELHVTNNDAASSSLLRMADHRKLFPSVEVQGSIRVVTRTLDSLLAEHRLPSPDALLLDVQGAEHRIIGSLPGHRLEKLQVLLTEASTAEVYEGSAPLEVIERSLAGTHRIEAYAPLTASVPQHGNALFLRRDPSRGHPKVTAIVSVYRAERFLEGCLRDLTEQTLFKQGQLEILVVNTGSDQGEAGIAERWAGQHENIRYISTPERRTLYAAWNLGLAAARGRYITNANADDRHIPEALETLAAVLDQDSTIDLVYSDCAPTADPEVDVTRALASGRRYRYPDYFAPDVLLHYQFGIHPLWRRSVNARLGGFDESFQAAGDYEFNIRFALAGRKARHVDRVLGVYHSGPGTLTHGSSRIHEETAALLRNYRSASNILRLYSLEGAEVETPMGAACMLGDFGIRCLGQPQPWLEGGTTSNRALARIIWQAADAIQPGWRKHLDILPSAARIQQLDPEDATFVAENFESSSRELASV